MVEASLARCLIIKLVLYTMRFCKYILLLVLAAVFLSGYAFGEVRVRAQADSENVIYVGEEFGYHIILDGVRSAGQVDTAPLSAYRPQYAGGSDRSQRSISIINGKKTERVSEHFVMSYRLVADNGGTIRLGGVNVVVDGVTYTTNEVTVNIVEPEKTDRIDLEIEFSRSKCYVGEPVLMTVRWFIRSSVARAVSGVSFNVPVFRSGEFYVEEALVKRAKSGDKPLGLMINGVQTAFYQRRIVRKGLDWIELSSSKMLIPRYAGNIVIDESMVSVDLAVGKEVQSRWVGSRRDIKRFLAKTAGKVLEVMALPESGKPASFYGLVGRYSIETSSDLTSVDVGQPIELTIRVGGSNYLKPVQWPRLEDVDELTDNFRVSDEREDGVVEGEKKIFKTTIRAENDSVVRIPPIPLTYFDVDKGKYVVTESAAIDLDVRPSEVFTFADVEMMGVGKINHEVEAVKKGISANYEDVKLVSEEFLPVAGLVRSGFAVVWAVPLAGFFVSAVVRILTYRDEKSVARKRRRQALRKSVRSLKHVRGLGKDDFEKSGRDAVAGAMRQYVGDRFDKTVGSLTGMDCERIVFEETGDGEMAKRYRELIEGFEASCYSGGSRGGDVGDVDGIIELMKSVEKKARR